MGNATTTTTEKVSVGKIATHKFAADKTAGDDATSEKPMTTKEKFLALALAAKTRPASPKAKATEATINSINHTIKNLLNPSGPDHKHHFGPFASYTYPDGGPACPKCIPWRHWSNEHFFPQYCSSPLLAARQLGGENLDVRREWQRMAFGYTRDDENLLPKLPRDLEWCIQQVVCGCRGCVSLKAAMIEEQTLRVVLERQWEDHEGEDDGVVAERVVADYLRFLGLV